MKTNSRAYIFIILIIFFSALLFFFLSRIIIYLIISSVMALINRPLMKLFGKINLYGFKISNSFAALLTILTFYSIIWLIISLFLPVIFLQLNIISNADWNQLELILNPFITKADVLLKSANISHESLSSSLISYFNSYFDIQKTSIILNSLFDLTGQIISALFAVTFISFFFLKDQNIIQNFILLLFPNEYENKVRTIIIDTKKMLSGYFIGLLFDILVVAVLYSIGMNIIGVNNSIIIGVFAGLMNIIPYVGPVLGILFSIFVGITSTLGSDIYIQAIPLLIKISSVGIIVQLIDMTVVQPYIFSNSVKAHPLEIFLIIISAATLGGIPAMIVAIPLYTVFRVVAKQFLARFKLIKKLTEDI